MRVYHVPGCAGLEQDTQPGTWSTGAPAGDPAKGYMESTAVDTMREQMNSARHAS